MKMVCNYCQSLWFWRCMHSLLKLSWALFCCWLWVILPQVIEERWVGGVVHECNIILPPIDAICFPFFFSVLFINSFTANSVIAKHVCTVDFVFSCWFLFIFCFFVCFVLVPTEFKRSHSRYVVCCCLWVRVYFLFIFVAYKDNYLPHVCVMLLLLLLWTDEMQWRADVHSNCTSAV